MVALLLKILIMRLRCWRGCCRWGTISLKPSASPASSSVVTFSSWILSAYSLSTPVHFIRYLRMTYHTTASSQGSPPGSRPDSSWHDITSLGGRLIRTATSSRPPRSCRFHFSRLTCSDRVNDLLEFARAKFEPEYNNDIVQHTYLDMYVLQALTPWIIVC